MQIIKQCIAKSAFLPLVAVLAFLLPVGAAHAALVSYTFTGNVSNVNGALLPTVNLTSAVSGSFQFDNATTGTMTPQLGNYPGAVTGLTLSIGGYTASYVPGANSITLFNNDVTFGDRWRLITDASGAAINGYTPIRFDLQLDHETGGAFSSTNLQNPPSLASLTGTRWRLIFENADGNLVRIQGALSSLTAVPLPAAVLLFGAGLISLVGLGAGGFRNLRGSQV